MNSAKQSNTDKTKLKSLFEHKEGCLYAIYVVRTHQTNTIDQGAFYYLVICVWGKKKKKRNLRQKRPTITTQQQSVMANMSLTDHQQPVF